MRELEAFPGWTWRPFDGRFERGLAALSDYVLRHGSAKVPQAYRTHDGFPLGTWVNARRQALRKGRLGADRRAALEAFRGWTWEPLVDDFPAGFAALMAYLAEKGHALVPATYVTPDGFRLGSWVVVRRADYHSGRLDSHRVTALVALPGWSWDPRSESFISGLAEVRLFVQEHGHCRIPRSHRTGSGFALGLWVGRRQDEFRAGRLEASRARALVAIKGWSWDTRADQFNRGLDELKEFVDVYGHARVHLDYRSPSGFRLGRWVNARRIAYRQGRLPEARIEVLSSIQGWEWNPGHGRLPVEGQNVPSSRSSDRDSRA
jgi:hypothetical protein